MAEQPPLASHDGREGPRPSRPFLFASTGLVVKLAFLAAVNGLAVYGAYVMADRRSWAPLAVTVAATVAIDWVYLGRRRIAAKYLIPGTVFLLAFQVYPVLYNVYVSFTNYGTGNLLTKGQALDRILSGSVVATDSGDRYQMMPVTDGDAIGLLLTAEDGQVFLGTESGLREVDEADLERDAGGAISGYRDFRRMTVREAQDRQDDVTGLRVPVEGGFVRAETFTSAATVEQRLTYDDGADTVTDHLTGAVYRPEDGVFTSPAGAELRPGWRVVVGPTNFSRVLTSEAIRGPFLRVFLWTYVFALGSVVSTFVVGLLLALALNDRRVRGRRTYRSLLIVPYALPSFMSALIWAGLLNRDFGAVNRLLSADLPWLTDPTMAKVSVLLVNLWLGFPYMFLITTGALQAIPEELKEAAYVDGASGVQAFRRVVFPLLLVSVAPLLISSFAFNFNNFNVIYLLTRGRPPIAGAEAVGHTDILISYTYRLAFEGGRGTDYGFAAAISVIIFFLVATFSALSFRATRRLEELS